MSQDKEIEVRFFCKTEQAIALAQFLKRIDYDTIKNFTANESELFAAQSAIADVQWALKKAGISVR